MLRTFAYSQSAFLLIGAIVSGMPNLFVILQNSDIFSVLGDITEVYSLFIRRPLENVISALGLQSYSPLIDAGVIWSTAVQISGARTGILPRMQLSLRARFFLSLLGPYLRAILGVFSLLAIMVLLNKLYIETNILIGTADSQFDPSIARQEFGTMADEVRSLLEIPEFFYFLLLLFPSSYFISLYNVIEINTRGTRRRAPFEVFRLAVRATPEFVWYYSLIVAIALLGRLLDGQLLPPI